MRVEVVNFVGFLLVWRGKNTMKKLSLLTSGLLCVGLLGACSNQQMNSEASKNDKSSMTSKSNSNQATKMAKDFALQGVDGKTYKLSDFKGKKVYLKFWASWCSICLSTLGDTNDLAKEQSGKDYVVLSVVSPTFNGEKSADDFKEWYKSLDYKDFPVLMDTKGELLKEYGIRSYPSALFVGSDGSLAKTHIGYMSKEDIEKTLKEIK